MILHHAPAGERLRSAPRPVNPGRPRPGHCRALFEPELPRHLLTRTHSCDRLTGHTDAHHCPICRTDWEDKPQ